MQLLAFGSVVSLARRPRGRVVTPMQYPALRCRALCAGAQCHMCRHSWIAPHRQARASPGPAPCASPSRSLAVTAELAPAAQPRPADTDTARFPDTGGSSRAGRESRSLFRRRSRFYSTAGGTEAGGRTTAPRLPRGRGISRRAPRPAGLAERGGPVSPPPPPAASPGGPARSAPLPVLVAAAAPWGWAGAGGHGALTGKVPAGGRGLDATRGAGDSARGGRGSVS